MMDIMVVDDEWIIRQGMEKAITGLDETFRVIGTADDGETALEFLKTADRLPDLIITDIFMKYVDGIEFIEQVNRLYPQIKCAILSGHEDFRLAQKAIDLKVSRYITKPVEIEQLRAILSEIRTEIENERHMRAEQIMLERMNAHAAHYVRDKLILDLLEGRLVSLKDFEPFAPYFPFSLDGSFVAGVIRTLKERPDLTDRDLLLYSVAVRYLFTEAVLEKRKGFILIKDMQTLYFGLQADEDWTGLHSLLSGFPQLAASVLGIRLAIGLSRTPIPFGNLQTSIQEAMQELARHGTSRSNDTENGKKTGGENCVVHPASEETNGIVAKVKAYMEENYGNFQLSLQLLADVAGVHPNYLTQVFRKHTGLSCIQYLARLRMEKAKQLLHGTNLKICEIAERVGYENPLYFSSYFKKWVGMNPSDFKEECGSRV